MATGAVWRFGDRVRQRQSSQPEGDADHVRRHGRWLGWGLGLGWMGLGRRMGRSWIWRCHDDYDEPIRFKPGDRPLRRQLEESALEGFGDGGSHDNRRQEYQLAGQRYRKDVQGLSAEAGQVEGTAASHPLTIAIRGGGVRLRSLFCGVLREAKAGELPAGGGAEEVSVGGADVGGGSDAGAAAKDNLRGHELAVVLAEGAGEGFVTGVAGVAGGCPLPYVAEELLEAGLAGGRSGVEAAGFEEVGDRGQGEGRDGKLAPVRGSGVGLGVGDGSTRIFDFIGGGDGGVLEVLDGGVLPLELGGETVAGPAGGGGGLEEAEVADGSFAEVFEGLPAVEGVDAPAGGGGLVATPVERRLPAFGVEGDPALGEPELGAVVAVLVDEGEVFGAGDEAGGEAEGLEGDGGAGGLVVGGKG